MIEKFSRIIGCALSSVSAIAPKAAIKTSKTERSGKISTVTLSNSKGTSCEVITIGAALRSLKIPMAEGIRDVVLGWETPEEWEMNPPFFGACIGRVSGRIAGARFLVDDKEYKTEVNDVIGENTLHGGSETWAKRNWTLVDWGNDGSSAFAELEIRSQDGESGFPGNVVARARYTLDEADSLRLTLTATTNAPTPICLTNHSYFNLAGSGDIFSHKLTMPTADAVLLTCSSGSGMITGETPVMAHPPLDFRRPTILGQRIPLIEKSYPFFPYGDAYVVNEEPFNSLKDVAVVEADALRMTVSTDMPVVQLYFSTFLNDEIGKKNQVYPKYGGICFECETYKDSLPQREKQSAIREAWIEKGSGHLILQPGETFRQTTVFKFERILESKY